jgi:universal stress protein G/universal stress protein F
MSFKSVLLPVEMVTPDAVEKEMKIALDLIADDGVIDILFVDDVSVHHSMAASMSYGFEKKFDAHTFLTEIIECWVPEKNRGKAVVRYGVIYDEIVAQARKSEVDAIIMASAKPKFRSYFLGSNASKVVRHASCSVVVVR